MATSNVVTLKTPENFDFSKPDQWSKWKRRFEQFASASGLDKEEDARRISTLLYCLGEEADDVLNSTNISAEDAKKYDKVIGKFDEYFQVRKNVIYERARFNRRDQLEGESAEEYITALYALVKTCDYKADQQDEMLRDRLVVGIRDKAVSDKLQLEAGLTLESAKKTIRQREAVKEHRQELQGAAGESRKSQSVVEGVTGRSTHKPPRDRARGASQNSKPPFKGRRPNQRDTCTRCGRKKHAAGERCPAQGVVCHRCNRKGHFKAQCLSKTVATVETPDDDPAFLDASFLGMVHTRASTVWMSSVRLGGKEVQFKLDTGAEVTAISDSTYHTLQGVKLKPATKPLYGPASQSLKVLGQFTGELTHKQNSCQDQIYVVKGLRNNLLGLGAIEKLQLVKRMETMFTQPLDVKTKFPKVFSGLGTLGEEYTICLKEDARPHALHTPRNIPLPLRDKVHEELDRMEEMGVISKVNDPIPWCAGMVVVPKKSGAVRICVDLKALNESVLRETHPIPKVDDTLAQLTGAAVFSKLDANSGFWQIPLSDESKLLTTFITPFGRYAFNKLPFGISSAPELFQKRMSKILEGLEGVVCLMDDVLIFGKDKEEHDQRLKQVLERIQAANVTLNPSKCEFHKSTVKFLGHVIDHHGIRADPDKIGAVCRMDPPHSVSDLRRFLGMVNQLGKFSPRIADLTQPLRELLSTKCAWLWGPEQEAAFDKVKDELVQPTVHTLYDPKCSIKISADASSFGLGAVLLQESKEGWKPVAYASRSLSETEQRYAQIEKEALAITWACSKFSDYILGRRFLIETDHKPLIPLLNTKHLDVLPPRILRFRLRLAKFDYIVFHVPGKLLYAADALSRAPMPETGEDPLEVEGFVESITQFALPASKQRLDIYRQAQKDDPVCAQVREYSTKHWPAKKFISADITPYWNERNDLTICNDLLMYKSRIVVPNVLREETLAKIHTGHQGIERCRMRVATSVWWPGVSQEVREVVERCKECTKEAPKRKEPLIITPLPEYPWQMVGVDLFELNKDHYILMVDYFSRYPEAIKLSSTTSAAVITVMKSIFARHGIPEVVRSDNGPQFSAEEFTKFANCYGFQHVTSSPRYPQRNGQVERMVQTVKKMIQKSDDPYLAIMSYRATPHPWCNLSPAELLMGRRMRTTIPQAKDLLSPNWSYLPEFRQKNKKFKETQKNNFDQRHRVSEQETLPDDAVVWVTSETHPIQGRVVSRANNPRSYVIETPYGELQRNRTHLNAAPEQQATIEQTPTPPRKIMTRSQTGTAIHPPNRLS